MCDYAVVNPHNIHMHALVWVHCNRPSVYTHGVWRRWS